MLDDSGDGYGDDDACCFVDYIGSPFQFLVNDPNKVTARGEGLGLVKCNQQTSFTVMAPGAQIKDLDVHIFG